MNINITEQLVIIVRDPTDFEQPPTVDMSRFGLSDTWWPADEDEVPEWIK